LREKIDQTGYEYHFFRQEHDLVLDHNREAEADFDGSIAGKLGKSPTLRSSK
jgi:hypothetical protein